MGHGPILRPAGAAYDGVDGGHANGDSPLDRRDGTLPTRRQPPCPPALSLSSHHTLHTRLQILGGAFDRLPESLRICFAHGGGAFPFLLGRLENAWYQRSIARGSSMHPPSHYLDRFSVDSAVFDERALRLLVETMGPHRVMLGSDYPFPLGEQDIGALVRGCGHLSDIERRMILGGNAASFFGVCRSCSSMPRRATRW